MPLRKLFLKEMQRELEKPQQEHEVLQLKMLSDLPPLLQSYLIRCGYIGKPLATNFYIVWADTYIKLKLGKDWTPINCRQFNTACGPARIALMQGKMLGFISLSGRDKYQNGAGNMLIKLANFTVSDAKGPEMDISALVTFLSEVILLPAAALGPSITWKQLDNNALNATITDKGLTASGTFYFDENGLPYRFDTQNRFYSTGGNSYRQYEWSAYFLVYKELNGLYLPSEVSASWRLPNGEYTYFRGKIATISYGLKSVSEAEL